jgi:hypothetical protein
VTAPSNRFRFSTNDHEWDVVNALPLRQPTERETERILMTGHIAGDKGALLLLLPGIAATFYSLGPTEARALRDALNDRVTEHPDAEPERTESTESLVRNRGTNTWPAPVEAAPPIEQGEDA